MNQDHNLVWMDLEMTGLRPNQDVILEIACVITDSNLTVIAVGPSLVIKQPDELLADMNDVVRAMHTTSGLIEKVRESEVSFSDAYAQTLSFIKSHCAPGTAHLCGSSIWQDRLFLQKYMPDILTHLHYRMIDVSSIKECVTRWYAFDPQVIFEKKKNHRALDDVYESIAELKHYRKYFFV